MDSALKIIYLFGGIFLLMTLTLNFLIKRFPRIPGDLDIERPGLTIYIPFTSSIIITVLITILFNYFFG